MSSTDFSQMVYRWASIFIASIVLLSACTAKSEPADQPMEALSSQEATVLENSESGGERAIPQRPIVDPPVDPVLTGDNRADAVAVAQHFVQVYPYMLKTGDTSFWQRYSSPECKFCQETLDAARERNKSGAWIDGDLELKNPLLRVANEGETLFQVEFSVERTGVVEHLSTGEKVVPNHENRVLLIVSKDSQWTVKNFQIGKAAENNE